MTSFKPRFVLQLSHAIAKWLIEHRSHHGNQKVAGPIFVKISERFTDERSGIARVYHINLIRRNNTPKYKHNVM